MGLDPDAQSGSHLFSLADKHLALAREAGLGTNRLNEIGVVGTEIANVVFLFKTGRSWRVLRA